MLKSALAALAALTPCALGQSNGTIVFTDELTDAIYSVNAPLSVTSLYSFGQSDDTRLAGITIAGGQFYVANGPSGDSGTPAAGIYRLNGLFSGSASAALLAGGDPLLNPIGLAFDAARGQLLVVNNPNTLPSAGGYLEGILGVDLGSGAVSTVYAQPANRPGGDAPGFAQYEDGVRIVVDPLSDSFYVIDGSGGGFGGGAAGDGGPRGSALWRVSIDNLNVGNVSLVVDATDTSVTGLAERIGLARGVAAAGSQLFITDSETNSVYAINLDSNGDFQSMSAIATGFDGAQDIVYNQYTGKLVFSDFIQQRIYQMNLDGSGLEVLAEGVNARGLTVVPSPGSLLALGGCLLTSYRRRR